MTLSPRLRRAALFGLALTVAACDVVRFAQDPKPRLVQTWNFPMSTTTISVASLLPSGVTIFSTAGSTPPDSSAFAVSVPTVAFSRRVGDDCSPCQTLNGTTAPKPAFVVATGSASNLPANVVSAAILAGTLTYSVTNGLSFDPLRVSTTPGNPQGYMIIVVRSGSIVLGRDSVNGATTALPPSPAAGSVLTRSIVLQTGNVTGAIAVDLTLNSPAGDHNEFINANGTLATSATLNTPAPANAPTLHVADVRINVPNVPMTTQAPTELPDDLDENLTTHVISGAIEMTITNPFAVAGNLSARFDYGTQPAENVTKTLALPTTAGPQVRTISLDSTEMHQILCGPTGGGAFADTCPQTTTTTLTMSGGVTSAAPILVTPKQAVTISNRLIIKVRVGGGS